MNQHVYCTDCIYGEQLIECIINEDNLPGKCQNCYPYDPEDSRSIELRINYKPKK